jgi:hypothetical protein
MLWCLLLRFLGAGIFAIGWYFFVDSLAIFFNGLSGCLGIVSLSYLKVMLHRHWLAIANPGADLVDFPALIEQFRFSCAAEVLE